MEQNVTRKTIYGPRVSLLLVGLLFSMIIFAQSRNVRGTVTDESGDPLIGVNVLEVGTTNGTTSDIDGNFVLSVASTRSELHFSYIGFDTHQIVVGDRSTLNVVLIEDVANLDEVVVVGYGTQTRREITGSVANVSEKDFNKGLTRDATDLLQGKVAGLMINSGSGDVTSTSNMRLRGTTTLQKDSGPLVVIDGVPGGDLGTISPADIESISVLKDATSAAIYGSRAAGGVVLITTKRGKGGTTKVNYDGYVSFDVISNKPDLMNADQWREYAKTADLDTSIYDQYGADTDWFDELTRTGVSHNHNLSLSGSGSNSNYRASYTYQDRVGVMADNEQKRHSFRLQAEQRALNDKLKLGLTASATITDQSFPDGRNYILAYNMLPVYPVYNEDGSWFTKVNGEFDQGNPVQNMKLNSRDNSMLYFYGNGDVQYNILDNLRIKTNLYKSRFSSTNRQFLNSETPSGMSSSGFAQKRNRIWDRDLMEWTLDYDETFGADEKHKFTGLLGYSWENNTYEYFLAQNRKFLSNDLSYNAIQAGTGLKTGDVESGKNSYTLISMFARAFYGYDDKYMITAMVRRDGSSKFGANHKWGLFPSVSAAWDISNEVFMKDVNWIDGLKLRAGYGVTGNQTGLDPYKSLELYGPSGLYFDSGEWNTGYAINQNPNPDLRWESTATANVGVDYSFLKGRVNGTVEWYDKRTYDMLYNYQVPTPPYVHDRMMANVGDMKNTGVEMLVNVDIIKQRDFSWTTSLNASYNKNVLTSLSNDIFETERVYEGDPWIRGGSGVTSHVVEEGRPIGQFFMLECTGISEDGKYIFTDVNDDGIIDNSDRKYVGSALPDVLFGWNNSFSYKQFDLSIFFRGSLGNHVFNGPRAAYANNTYLPGTNAINDPLIYKLKGQSSQICSYYIEDASFVRLDNMSIGYTFKLPSASLINNARIYLAAQNLFVLTKYKGLDPEVDLDGLSPGIEKREFYPKAKTFTFGVNLSF